MENIEGLIKAKVPVAQLRTGTFNFTEVVLFISFFPVVQALVVVVWVVV